MRTRLTTTYAVELSKAFRGRRIRVTGLVPSCCSKLEAKRLMIQALKVSNDWRYEGVN